MSRPLGTPGWDLAGVRFTAMLNAALDPRPAPTHLLLDDDIRLAGCSYGGQSLEVDASAVGKGLQVEAPGDGIFAAGAPFLGRADLSALEHFAAFLDKVAGKEPVPVAGTTSSPSFPAVVTSVPHVHPDSPGVSGGFLLTTRDALRTVPLAKSYNEDWIWLRQLATAGGTIRALDFAVVHAGPRNVRLSPRALFSQFEGDVLDLALALGAERADRFADEAFRACARRLDAVVDRARALAGASAAAEAGPGLGTAVPILERVQARVRGASPVVYAAKLAQHLRRSFQWRDAFAALERRPASGG